MAARLSASPCRRGAAEKLDRYAQLLVEWNQKMNLTAITEPREIVYKHFVDSLLLLKAIELPQGASLIDVGTGAGFPSMPVKIAREDLKVTLLDSLQKRLTFLQEVNVQLGLDCAFIHARAEDGGKDKKLREQFDFASAPRGGSPAGTGGILSALRQGGGLLYFAQRPGGGAGDQGGKERRRDDGRQGRAGSAFFAAGRQRKKHRADQKNIAHSAFLPQNRRQNGKKTDSLNRFAGLEVEISRTIFLEKRNTLCYDRGMDAGRQSAPGVHAFSIPIFLSFARQVRSP